MRLPKDLERKCLELAVPGTQVKLPHVEPANEAEFQDQVIALFQRHGWRVAHFRRVRVQNADGSTRWMTPVQADGAGFFDLECVREVLVKAELKFGRNKLTKEQREWQAAYCIAGVFNYIWYPADWTLIEHIAEKGLTLCQRGTSMDNG